MEKKQIVEEMVRILKDSPAVIYEPNAHPLEYIDGAKDKFFVTADNGHLIINYETLAKALCDAGYRKQEWISVDERLPDRNGRYLVAMKNGDDYHISTRKFRRADPPTWWKGHTFGHWARNTGGVRYWKPLPEAPKGGTE